MKIFLLSLVASIFFGNTFSQVTQHQIDPSATGADIKTIHGPHYALIDPKAKQNGKLLLFIVGTNGNSDDWIKFADYAATLGYHSICIDYKNLVNTVACVESRDSACFDGFRQEIMFGSPVSPMVEVDSANSIMNRVTKLLQHLSKTYPGENWNQFLNGNNIVWTKVVAAGHSQGAGHVVFLGKKYLLDRIIILAGPQDFLANFNSPASWLSRNTTTPLSKYFACLHLKDPYNFNRQLANCNTIMVNHPSDTLMVYPQAAVKRPAHILVADNQTDDAHGAFRNEAFKQVWDYLLKF